MRQEICAGALHAFGVWHARGAYLMKQDDTHISIDHEPFRRTRVPAAGYLRVVIYRWTTFEPMPGRLAKLGFETALSSQYAASHVGYEAQCSGSSGSSFLEEPVSVWWLHFHIADA